MGKKANRIKQLEKEIEALQERVRQLEERPIVTIPSYPTHPMERPWTGTVRPRPYDITWLGVNTNFIC